MRQAMTVSRREVLMGLGGLVAGSLTPWSSLQAMVDPEVSGYLAAPGGRLWYRINGVDHLSNGPPPLVVLHGGPGSNHRGFVPLSALSDERAVILYDQLDSGHSDRPGDPVNWTVERFVAEISALRDGLGLSQFVLLGHSAGGAWAAQYALDVRQGLAGLILSSPLLSTPRWLEDARKLREKLPPEVLITLERNEAAGTTDSDEYRSAVEVFYDRHLCRSPCDAGDLANDRPPFNQTLYEYMWGRDEFVATGSLKSFDLTDRLGSIQIPVAIVCGEYDEATPETCRYFASLIPGASVYVIEDAAHTAYITRTSEYVAVLRKILNAL